MPPYTASVRPAPAEIQKLVAEIGNQFAIQGTFLFGEEIDSGHINSTYRATYLQPDGSHYRYIFQAINRYVFKDPYAVMRNVERVTRHINAKVMRKKHDLAGQTLNLYPARTGGSWVEDESGTVWRCYNNIEGCVTFDVVENTAQAFQAAHAFGAFQDLVSDLDPTLIQETIPDFHHTRKRFETLLATAKQDPLGRLAGARREFDFVHDRESITGKLIDLTAQGAIPIRIAHNDTKINNVMIDTETHEAVCVIDLDTVMPGLALHDFGDLVRTATSPAAEDGTDLSKVEMRMPVFEALVDGYLGTAGSFLNETEIEHLAFSGKLIALELGMRFLTDHLEGDTYFKIQRPGQNLDRCRTQLMLAAKIEEQESRMMDYVWKKAKRSGV
ncbi:aminoglycoside phosphotransferase family protein [Luteolibacter pohnpeiensis]|uniref:Aminoglycoside phosphotransferase family protein n=1 Tax=Luteolibacter pohnpeiensis TaxID=454153 RepID=A0A934S2M7_9BACT|nr:phosphotransferase [Luteolibacter pohnpeiensis]MBK1881207.1 aminoglycoside phosphotransferase family protein [Luteolibacter pohnpeiensis]